MKNQAEIVQTVLGHKNAYLLEVLPGNGGGKYPKVYPARLFVNDTDTRLLTRRGCKSISELSDMVEFMNGLNVEEEALLILKGSARHANPFMSTNADDEKRFSSPEKSVFLGHDFHMGDFRIAFKFYVTSYEGSVSMRVSHCPEACYPRIEDIPENIRRSDFEPIASFGWSQNGSGFNQKYVEAIAFLHRFKAGDWEGVNALTQENRSTSISNGEPRTRFWSAILTYPDKARGVTEFPLFIATPLPKRGESCS